MCDVSAATSVDLSSKVSVAVARKALDAQSAEGEAIAKMLSSVEAIARANAELAGSSGSRVDVYA